MKASLRILLLFCFLLLSLRFGAQASAELLTLDEPAEVLDSAAEQATERDTGQIRTRLTAEGGIKPKWKHELTLFHAVRSRYPDTLYQHRPGWLGRQSLDLFIPSLQTAIEYQGIQHYRPVDFFGGEDALQQRKELDRVKRQLCEENHVRLIEWPYSTPPTEENVEAMIGDPGPADTEAGTEADRKVL